jgi:hypothetical protein
MRREMREIDMRGLEGEVLHTFLLPYSPSFSRYKDKKRKEGNEEKWEKTTYLHTIC